jgi:MFS family permease
MVGLTMLAFVLAIPFGWFADKYGRKKLLVMLSVAFFLRVAWQLTVCMYSFFYDDCEL